MQEAGGHAPSHGTLSVSGLSQVEAGLPDPPSPPGLSQVEAGLPDSLHHPPHGKSAYLFLTALSNGSSWLGQAGAELLNEQLPEPSSQSGQLTREP